jgi:hypothetical protein
MHARSSFLISLLLSPLGCATVAPVGAHVTGAIRQTKVGVVLPPQFTWPVSGVEGWAAIDRLLTGLGSRSKLALVDPREIDFGDTAVPEVQLAWAQSNLADVASRMNLNRQNVLLIQPVIDRQTRKKKIRQSGQTVFVKAADYVVRLKLELGAKRIGSVVVKRSLSPMDLAVLEDESSVWLDLLDEASANLAKEFKAVSIIRAEVPSYVRESLASMAGRSVPGLVSPMAIPDTLRRLTALDQLTRLAKVDVRGQELERRLEQPPGLRVIADSAPLKKGDLVLTAETLPVRHPLTLARLRALGVVHLEVLRDGKELNLILEPQ